MKVLYIGSNSKKFQKASEKYRFYVEGTSNGMTALKMLKTDPSLYTLIICEYDLTGNNGIYLYQLLQKSDALRAIPFILVSKVFDEKIYTKCFEINMTDYFVLNTSKIDDILNRVDSLLYKTQKITVENTTTEAIKNTEPYKFPLSKRICDIILSLCILILILPLLLIVIFAIKIESRGKFYYVTKRVGRKTFDFYKLRSMKTGSDSLLKKLSKKNNLYKSNPEVTKIESECPECKKLKANETCSTLLYIDKKQICEYWHNVLKINSLNHKSKFIKIPNDPRVTMVGKIIRNTSIDELPQLINVLKGDMSIVGNRPLPLYEAELLTNDYMSKRFLAPAGITGLWQVELRGKKGKMSEDERMKLDNIYSDYFTNNNYSLWFDLKIMLKTIPALFQKSSV